MPKIHLERAITVNLDSGEQVKLLAGGNDVADEIAEHWFVKAHMVKELDAAEITDAPQSEVIEALQLSLEKAGEQIDQLTTNLQNAGASITALQAENLELRASIGVLQETNFDLGAMRSQRESELEAQVVELQRRLDALNATQSVPVVVDHAAMTVDQLKALLTEKGISFNSRDTKAELIALLG